MGSKAAEKFSYLAYSLKLEPMKFAAGLDIGWKKMAGVVIKVDTKTFS